MPNAFADRLLATLLNSSTIYDPAYVKVGDIRDDSILLEAQVRIFILGKKTHTANFVHFGHTWRQKTES